MSGLAPPCCCSEWIGGLAHTETRRLVAVARRQGLGPDDALDAVQEGFHTLLGRPDVAALKTRPADAANLLAAIVRNAARNMRRRHFRRAPHRELTDGDLGDGGAGAPDRAMAIAETSAALVGCVQRLDLVHRHVVALRVLEEVSGAEAARVLGLTPGHVAVLLHRARKELERCMLAPAR